MSSSVDTIISHLNTYNDLQRQSRFKVFFGPSPTPASDSLFDSELLSLRCESVDIPGRTLDTFDHRTYGPIVKYPRQSYFSEITLTFICSANYSGKNGQFPRTYSGLPEKRFFEDWMQFINVYPNGNGSENADYAYHNFKYKDEYARTIEIRCYDTDDSVSFTMNLLRAFPTQIGSVGMTWTSEEVARLPVTFTYETFTYIRQPVYQQRAETFDLSTQQSAPPETVIDRARSAGNAISDAITGAISGIFR
jgi:hypothetical protein